MPDEPELPEAVAWGAVSSQEINGEPVALYPRTYRRHETDVPLYTRAQLTAHAEAVAAVRVREARKEWQRDKIAEMAGLERQWGLRDD